MNDYRNGAKYFDAIHRNVPPRELRFYRRFVRRGANVLDVGCGTGRLSLELARVTSRCKFDCIDTSDEMLSIYKTKLEKLEPLYTYGRSIRLVKADMRSYASDRHYDVIMFPFQSIQTLPTRQGVTECLRHLKTMLSYRGVMIISAFNPRIGMPENAKEKINGFGIDKEHLYLSCIQDMRFTNDTYRYTERIKVFDAKHGFLMDEAADDFEVCAVDYDFIVSLQEECGLSLRECYGDYKMSRCNKESRDVIAVFGA